MNPSVQVRNMVSETSEKKDSCFELEEVRYVLQYQNDHFNRDNNSFLFFYSIFQSLSYEMFNFIIINQGIQVKF